jgi:hypothetical protein
METTQSTNQVALFLITQSIKLYIFFLKNEL